MMTHTHTDDYHHHHLWLCCTDRDFLIISWNFFLPFNFLLKRRILGGGGTLERAQHKNRNRKERKLQWQKLKTFVKIFFEFLGFFYYTKRRQKKLTIYFPLRLTAAECISRLLDEKSHHEVVASHNMDEE